MIPPPVREAIQRLWERHPRLRKIFVVGVLCPALMVATATVAYADNTKTTAPSSLTWMDIKDSHGISVWKYELSLDRGGVTNPGKLVWSVLTEWMWQFYRAFVAIAIWIIDWVLSFSWLGTVAGPVMSLGDNLAVIVGRFGLAPVLLTITALVAVMWMMRGRWVTGIFELFLSLIIASLAVGVLANPVGLVADDDGLLIESRDFGLAISSGLINDGNTDGSPDEMREDITATLADTFIRQPTQLINFGEVVDGGKCEETYDEVIKDGPYGTDDDIRDAMDGCEDRLGEVAEHPNAGMAMSAGVLYPAAFIVLLFAVILAGTVLVASVQALYRGLKLIIDLVLALLPGSARGSLWMSVADLVMSLLTVVFACVFLTGFLLLIQSVFAEGGNARMQTFFAVDVLLVVGIVIFWRGRGRIKEASERLAQALAKRPGGAGPSSLPARSKFSPHEAYYKGRMAIGAAKIASTGAMTLSSGGLALAAGAGRAAASAGRTAARPVTDSASRIQWAGGVASSQRAEPQPAAPAAPAELTSAQRVQDRVGGATSSGRGQLARVGGAVLVAAPGGAGGPGSAGGPGGPQGNTGASGSRGARSPISEARRAALSQRMHPAAELAGPGQPSAASPSQPAAGGSGAAPPDGMSPPVTARTLARPGLTPAAGPGASGAYERVETGDAVALVPQNPAGTGQVGDPAAAARLRARLEQRRAIALPGRGRGEQT